MDCHGTWHSFDIWHAHARQINVSLPRTCPDFVCFRREMDSSANRRCGHCTILVATRASRGVIAVLCALALRVHCLSTRAHTIARAKYITHHFLRALKISLSHKQRREVCMHREKHSQQHASFPFAGTTDILMTPLHFHALVFRLIRRVKVQQAQAQGRR